MNRFRRAWISLKRLPVKSGILFLSIFLMGALLLGALLVRNSINLIEEHLMRRLPSIVTTLRPGFPSEFWVEQLILMDNRLTGDIVQEIGALPEVRAYDFTLSAIVWSLALEPGISTPFSREYLNYSHSFNLIGGNNHLVTDIESGMLELLEGRTFTPEEIYSGAHLAIVPRAFAEVNGFSVGSTFEISDIIHNYPKFFDGGEITPRRHLEAYMLAHRTLAFEIIGIFDLAVPVDMSDLDRTMGEGIEAVLTSIYVPFQIVEEIYDFRYETIIPFFNEWAGMTSFNLILVALPSSEAIFVLESAHYFEDFNEQARHSLPDHWEFIDNSGMMTDILTAMASMREISNGILWLSVSALSFILTFVIWLFLYDRRREIGVYRALGETKKNIVVQISTEVSAIFFVAMGLSLFVGSFVAGMISRHLTTTNLTEDAVRGAWISTQSEVVRAIWTSSQETLMVYDVSLDLLTVLLSVGMGMMIVLLALGISLSRILRLAPKKILMSY